MNMYGDLVMDSVPEKVMKLNQKQTNKKTMAYLEGLHQFAFKH